MLVRLATENDIYTILRVIKNYGIIVDSAPPRGVEMPDPKEVNFFQSSHSDNDVTIAVSTRLLFNVPYFL